MLVAFLLLSALSTTLATHIPFSLSNHRLSSLTTANTHAYYENGRKMTIAWDAAQISNSANTKLEVTLRSSTNALLRTLSGETGIFNTGSVDWTVNYGSACANCKLYFRTLNLGTQKSGYTAAFDLTMTTLAAITVAKTTGVCSKSSIRQGTTYSLSWTTLKMADSATFDVALLKASSVGGVVSFDRHLQQGLSTKSTTFKVPEDLSTNYKYYLTVSDSSNSELYDACPSKSQWSVIATETCDYSSRKADNAWVKTDKSKCEKSSSGGGEGASTKCGQGSSLVMECKEGYMLNPTKSLKHCSASTRSCAWECNTEGEWEGGSNIPCVKDPSASSSGTNEHRDGFLGIMFYIMIGLVVLVVLVIVVALAGRSRGRQKTVGVQRSNSIASVTLAWAVPVSEDVPATATVVVNPPMASAPPISPVPSREGSIELRPMEQKTGQKCDVEAPPDTSNPMHARQLSDVSNANSEVGGGSGGGGGACNNDCMFFFFFVSAFLLIPVWIAWLCYWRKDERIARAPRNVNLYTHALNAFYILFFSISAAIMGSN